MRVFVLLLFCTLIQAAEPPRFEQFPASGPAFHGTPAPARPLTKKQLLFKTMIRDGATKGPNFAGHYTIVEWGCGASCVSNAMVDAKTGAVYDFPFDTLIVSEGEPLSYRLDSRLLVARGCPNEGKNNCGTHYYEWTGTRFTPLQ